ncbi:MAG: hydrogenase maturation peptidase HycI [Candidatus Bathyarchaeota archaeon]
MQHRKDDRLKDQLEKWLVNSRKVAILGVGSAFRGDDNIGPTVVRNLSKTKLAKNIKLFNCGTTPERFTKTIQEFKPTHIIIIDSARLNLSPGEADLISTDKIGGLTISTHTLPLNVVADYLYQITKAKIILLGVQPKSLDFSNCLTPELEKAARNITDIFVSINEITRG